MEIIMFLLIICILILIIPVYIILKTISLWIVFKNNNQNEWISLIPIYRNFVALKIANLNLLFGILFFVPGLQLIGEMVLTFGLSKKYKLSNGLVIINTIFPIFGFPCLIFSKERNKGNNNCSNCGYPKKGAGIYCVNCGTKL